MSYRPYFKGGNRVGFTPGQQPALRQDLAMAWAEHCRAAGVSVAVRCAKSKRCGHAATCGYCAWYEDVLAGATGHRSTTACTATEDYERFMAALEEIHQTSIVWQVKRDGGNVRRLEWLISSTLPGKTWSLAFLRGVARKALQRDSDPDLEQITKEERQTVLEALKAIEKREGAWVGNQEEEPSDVEEPF